MGNLGRRLLESSDQLVASWLERWLEVAARPDLEEAALRNSLPAQLRLIAEQLTQPERAESPHALWQEAERLAPEARVAQGLPIEEVVLEYGILVDVVQRWIGEEHIDVSFEEYSYFFSALFELVAESVRRYAEQQAADVTRDRSLYLASVAHQMRTPLTSLRIHVDLLRAGKAEASPRVLGSLDRSVRALSRMVGGVLRTERFHTADIPVVPVRCRPAQLIDEVVEDFEHDASRKGLRFEVVADRSLEMHLDVGLFVDALGNLIDNAIKYTEQGFIRLEMLEEDDCVTFRVSDSGPGIPPEVQARLFKAPVSSTGGGLGLGLSIVHRAVTAQGGRVSVDSVPGRGSRFSFQLPRDVSERRADGSAPSPQA